MKPPKPQRRLQLSSPSSLTQAGLVNQAGTGNSQTIHLQLVTELNLCKAGYRLLEQQLALMQALVAAKEETIALLRAGHCLPN